MEMSRYSPRASIAWSIATTFLGSSCDPRPEDGSEEVRAGKAPGQARAYAGGSFASSVSTKRRKCGSLVFSSSGWTLPSRSNEWLPLW